MTSGATRTEANSIGPFRLLRRLGAGGMAEVWEAQRREPPGDRVALKTLPRSGAETTGAEVRKFWEEARIAKALDHPNIVRTLQAGVAEERVFLVMELLEGRTLAQLDGRDGRLPLGLVGGIAVQLLEGLAHAHQGLAQGQGLVHRDIKPSNLFVTTLGIAKVIDFGLAVLPGVDRTLTRSGLLRGSLPYCSPEQVKHEPMDARADLFSFGLVLYELLTGRRVFNQETEAGILSAVLWTPVPPLRHARSDVSPQLEALVHAVLEKAPEARPRSAAELSAALRAALGPEDVWTPGQIAAWLQAEPVLTSRGAETASTPDGSVGEMSALAALHGAPGNEALARPRRRPWAAAAAGVLVLAALGGGAAWWGRTREVPASAKAATGTPPERVETAPALAPTPSVTTAAAPTTAVMPEPPLARPKPGTSTSRASRSAATGWLTVGTRSGWANVSIDGKARGPTPLFHLTVPAGRHRIEARRPDGTVVTRNVLVEPGKEAKLILAW